MPIRKVRENIEVLICILVFCQTLEGHYNSHAGKQNFHKERLVSPPHVIHGQSPLTPFYQISITFPKKKGKPLTVLTDSKLFINPSNKQTCPSEIQAPQFDPMSMLLTE